VRTETVDAVLEKLGVGRPATDLDGLRAVYAAWCGAVAFDNVLKLIHLADARPGPLPGSTAESFFEAWLADGTGGTCWSGNGALHDLLEALGFDVERAIATMLSSPHATEPNHGSVVAAVDGVRWLVDASILSGAPLRLPDAGDAVEAGPLPRVEWRDGRPAVLWRTATAPDGFHCRIERLGADAAEWHERHQRTADWSPFNYQLSARLLDGRASVGVARGRRYRLEPDGTVSGEELGAEERIGFLVDVLGVAERIAVRVPADRPLPPRPG
jgi:N-hydroxyarylamine O-acetyltransferase